MKSGTNAGAERSPAGRLARLAIPVALAIAAFIIGYIHHRWFYPPHIHSDSSAMQVLAQAIVYEGNLLPRDFGYGNQLILFRSSPFIALALAWGLQGFDAFIIGSSLSIAFWSVILYAVLAACTADRLKSFLITLLFMIPMGIWDIDYVLGQQSHLSNIVMAACVVMLVHRAALRQQAGSLALAAGIVFLMAAEAPIRALLLVLPVVAGAVCFFGRRTAVRILGFMALALLLGILVNKGLQFTRPLGMDIVSSIIFRSTEEIANSLQQIGMETLGSITSVNVYTAKPMPRAALIFFLPCLAYLLSICAYGLWRSGTLVRTVRRTAAPLPSPAPAQLHEFTGAVAVLGLISGALAIAILNPGTARHMLWATGLLRLSFLLALFLWSARLIRSRALHALVLSACTVSASFWMAAMVPPDGSVLKLPASRVEPAINAQIQHFAQQLKIKRVIGGDFWRMLVLNTTIPGISAAVLSGDPDGNLTGHLWLSRRSTFDPGSEVLYYLKGDPVDQLIHEKLIGSGGRELYKAGKESLWVGKPVWATPGPSYSWNGCQLPTEIGQATAQCHMQDRKDAPAGHLTFGPYVTLPAGRYRFELEYAGGAAASNRVGKWDVAVTVGSKISVLNKGDINGTDDKAAHTGGEFTIGSKHNSGRIEIRTVSYAGSTLRIQALRIVRAY